MKGFRKTKSVDRDQIEAVAEKYRVPEITAERVIWLTRVLAELSRSSIGKDFALMGGSAIVYLYADLYRFSTDLDLDFIADGDLGRENLNDLATRHKKDEKALSMIADNLGLEFEKEEKKKQNKKDEGRFCQYHMFYRSVYRGMAKGAVGLDLSYRYCHSVLSTQRREWPLCSEADVTPFRAQTFVEEELYAGKAVALIGGERYDFKGKIGLGFKNPIRHLYDLYFLANSISKKNRRFDLRLFRRLLLLFGMTRIRNFDLQRGDIVAAFTQEDFDAQLIGVLRRHRHPPSLAEMQKRVRGFFDDILRWKGEEDRFIEDFKHKIFRPERILDKKVASRLKKLYYYDEIVGRVQLPEGISKYSSNPVI